MENDVEFAFGLMWKHGLRKTQITLRGLTVCWIAITFELGPSHTLVPRLSTFEVFAKKRGTLVASMSTRASSTPDSWSDRIIKWGTRSEWHTPTVFEVVAEEILPHVVLILYLFIFLVIWLILRDGDGASSSDANSSEDLSTGSSAGETVSSKSDESATSGGLRKRNKGKK